MSDEGTMLLDMKLDAAKALRRRYGDAKYGMPLRQRADWLGQAYIEAVDIDNYIDIGEGQRQLTSDDALILRARTSSLLVAMRAIHARRQS